MFAIFISICCNVGQQTYAMPYESYNAMKKISDGYNQDTGKKKLFSVNPDKNEFRRYLHDPVDII